MKILIDIQSLQGYSKYRGIGRYVSNLVKNMIATKSEDDEIYLLYNDWNEETEKDIINRFGNLVSNENLIKICLPFNLRDETYWYQTNEFNKCLLKQTELLREYIISKLKPDFVLISSYFELIGSSLSISNFFQTTTGSIIYDFLPMQNKKKLLPNKLLEDWYYSKIDSLKRSDLFLCISDFVANDAKEIFKDEKIEIKSISTASSDFWKIVNYSKEEKEKFNKKYKITKPFILYTGGIEQRKNIKSLIKSFASLEKIKQDYILFIVLGKVGDKNLEKELKSLAKDESLTEDKEIIFKEYISDEDMRMMYNLCELFVFPSLGEGFGLTPLEAMKCGATVITSNSTSLPEVVGLDDAMFDPTSIESISNKISDVLTDKELYKKIKNNSPKRSKLFSWEETAKKAWKYIKEQVKKSNKKTEEFSKDKFLDESAKIFSEYKDIKDFKLLVQDCIATLSFNENKYQTNKTIYIDKSLTNSTSNDEIIKLLPKTINDFEIKFIEVLTSKEIGIKNLKTGKAIFPNKEEIVFLNNCLFNNNSIINYIEKLKKRKTKFFYTNHKCLFGNDEDFDKLSKEDKEKAVEYFKKSIEVFSKLLKISKRNEIICIDNIYVND